MFTLVKIWIQKDGKIGPGFKKKKKKIAEFLLNAVQVTDLSHVLRDNEQAAFLFHNHAQQLHQVIVSQLPKKKQSHGPDLIFHQVQVPSSEHKNIGEHSL